MTHKIDDANFEAEVLKSSSPVLVDFYADWCGPCKQIAPLLEEISNEKAGKLKIAKMNIDDNPMTPSKYNVRSIPTMVIFVNGQAVDTKIGSMTKTALNDWIETAITKAA